jgi:hypothetical protein
MALFPCFLLRLPFYCVPEKSPYSKLLLDIVGDNTTRERCSEAPSVRLKHLLCPFVRFALEMQLYVLASACVLHHLTYLLVHFS